MHSKNLLEEGEHDGSKKIQPVLLSTSHAGDEGSRYANNTLPSSGEFYDGICI